MLTEFLIANGWKNCPAMDKMPPETKKELWVKPNEGTPSLTLHYTQMKIHGILTDFIAVSLVGEIDTFWHDMAIYSSSIDTFTNEEDKIINSLTKSWIALK